MADFRNWGLTRGTLESHDDSAGQQLIDARGLSGESFTKIYRPMQFGFTSNPPKGSDLALFRMGSSERILAMGVEHPDKRPKNLPDGVTAIYGADGEIASLVQRKFRVKAAEGHAVVVGNVFFRVTPLGVECNVPITAPNFITGSPPPDPSDEV